MATAVLEVVDEDALYSMLCRVIDKRKKYPVVLMDKEKAQFSAELQKLELMKVDLDDSDIMRKQTKLAAEIVKKTIQGLDTAVDLQGVTDQLNRKESNLAEIGLYKQLRKQWHAR